MTIERRLFISNILMLILPIILTIVLFTSVYYVFVLATGIDFLAMRAGHIPVEQLPTGEYVVIVPEHWGTTPINRQIALFAFFFPVMLGFVFMINRLLTKFVSRHIMTSINVLSNGVREISEGNLTYRIEHNKGNEFDSVCVDFNEMATRLSGMVAQRQADEKNRKELIAGISHDLRTPLTSIKGYLEGIKKGVAKTPEMQNKYLDTIQEKTENLEYIINQLFLFSKIDIGEFPFNMEKVNVENELKKIMDSVTCEYLEMGLTLTLNLDAPKAYISIDIIQFKNVVQNILNNSVKYGNKKNNQAEISCKVNAQNVYIVITDNGNGVSDSMLPQLFDVFYRGDTARSNPSKGSGLGLAICAKTVERLGGTIHAENAAQGGLSIIISLPMAKGGSE
jgi:signal transduction histidine kinase